MQRTVFVAALALYLFCHTPRYARASDPIAAHVLFADRGTKEVKPSAMPVKWNERDKDLVLASLRWIHRQTPSVVPNAGRFGKILVIRNMLNTGSGRDRKALAWHDRPLAVVIVNARAFEDAVRGEPAVLRLHLARALFSCADPLRSWARSKEWHALKKNWSQGQDMVEPFDRLSDLAARIAVGAGQGIRAQLRSYVTPLATRPLPAPSEADKKAAESHILEFRRGLHAQAIAAAKEALEADPTQGDALYAWAIALAARGNWKDAQDRLSASLDQTPAHDYMRCARLIMRGRARGHLMDEAGSLADFEEAGKLRPRYNKVQLWIGRHAIAFRKFDKALVSFAHALALTPEDGALRPALHLLRARVFHLGKSDNEAALAEVSKAIIGEPKNIEARLLRAELLLQKQEYGEAIKDFDAVLKLDHRNRIARTARPRAKRDWGRSRTAVEDYRESLSLFPKSLSLRLGSAEVRAEIGDEVGSVEDYTAALALPEASREIILKARGLLHASLGLYARAIADLEEAVALNPSFAADIAPTLAECRAGYARVADLPEGSARLMVTAPKGTRLTINGVDRGTGTDFTLTGLRPGVPNPHYVTLRFPAGGFAQRMVFAGPGQVVHVEAHLPGRILFCHGKKLRSLDPTTHTARDLTSKGHWIAKAVLSPDGLLVATTRGTKNADSHKGPTWPHIMAADGSGGRRIGEGDLARWSPDSRTVVWTHWARSRDDEERHAALSKEPWLGRQDIYIAQASGGPARKLIEGSDPRWSPDGAWILFTHTQGRKGASTHTVTLIRSDGSGMKPLGTGTGGRWSPDGSRVLMSTRDDSLKDRPLSVNTINVDGSNQRAHVLGAYARWSPDGTQILASYDPNGRANDGDELILVFEARTGMAWKAAVGYGARWSPDGRRIAFLRMIEDREDGAGPMDLYVVDADGKNERRLTKAAALTTRGTDVDILDFAWSPHSDQLAYLRFQGLLPLVVGPIGSCWLHAVKVDGTGRRLLWSPPRVTNGLEALSDVAYLAWR